MRRGPGSHCVAVKLGTITPEGRADVHCYGCDDAAEWNYGDVTDPALAAHLAAFGIDVVRLRLLFSRRRACI